MQKCFCPCTVSAKSHCDLADLEANQLDSNVTHFQATMCRMALLVDFFILSLLLKCGLRCWVQEYGGFLQAHPNSNPMSEEETICSSPWTDVLGEEEVKHLLGFLYQLQFYFEVNISWVILLRRKYRAGKTVFQSKYRVGKSYYTQVCQSHSNQWHLISKS